MNKFKQYITKLINLLLPTWWWSNLSDSFYMSKIAHDYKDGKIDYRFIRAWFLKQ